MNYKDIEWRLKGIQPGPKGHEQLNLVLTQLSEEIQDAMKSAEGNAQKRASVCLKLVYLEQEKKNKDNELKDVKEMYQKLVKRHNAKLLRTQLTAALCFLSAVAMLVFYALLSLRAYMMQNALRALPTQCHKHVNPSLLLELGLDPTPPADGGTANALSDGARALPATGGFW
jgi:hypothetical protein